MEDFYKDGFNVGYGRPDRNEGHDYPSTDQDDYSYRKGIEDGERRRRISEALDRDRYDD